MSWSLLGKKCEACGTRTRDVTPAPAGAGINPGKMVCNACAARLKSKAEARAEVKCGVCGRRTRDAAPMPGGATVGPPTMVCPPCAARFSSAAEARAEAKRLESEEARNQAADTVMRWNWRNGPHTDGEAQKNPGPSNALAGDLFLATDRGNASAVKALLGYGADVNARDEYGRTALSLACRRDRLGVVRTLISSGADVNAADTRAEAPCNSGMTPLHWAAGRGHTGVVELLLASGAGVDARDDEGLTPLHSALDLCPANVEQVLQFLLAAGADINAATNLGFTPLRIAAATAAKKNREDLPDFVRQCGGRE